MPDLVFKLLQNTGINSHKMRSLLSALIALSQNPIKIRVYDLDSATPDVLASLTRLFGVSNFAVFSELGQGGIVELLESSVEFKSRLATRKSLLSSLDLIGVTGDLKEWWELTPPGDPYTVSLFLWIDENPSLVDPAVLDEVLAFLRNASPAGRVLNPQIGVQYGVVDDGLFVGSITSAYPIVEIK